MQLKAIVCLWLAVLCAATSFAQSFNVGDKVNIYNSGAWYKGNIQQIGSDNYAGYYYVHYDGFNNGQWINGSNIKMLSATKAATALAPRDGLYTILSYGSVTNPIRLGYFDLSDGRYRYYNMAKKVIGSGSYQFDPASKSVRWLSGPFKDAQWGGSFETDRDGKTHKIRLNRVTIGSNSSDS